MSRVPKTSTDSTDVRHDLFDAGFVDLAAARRAAQSIVAAFDVAVLDVAQHDLNAKGGERAAALLKAIRLAARDIRCGSDYPRIEDADGSQVRESDLLQCVNVLLHLVETLFDRLGHPPISPVMRVDVDDGDQPNRRDGDGHRLCGAGE